jgi:hypothetical protein
MKTALQILLLVFLVDQLVQQVTLDHKDLLVQLELKVLQEHKVFRVKQDRKDQLVRLVQMEQWDLLVNRVKLVTKVLQVLKDHKDQQVLKVQTD